MFTEFLLESKAVEADALLGALVEQVSKLPSTLEAVQASGQVPPGELLRVLAYQAREGVDFCTALTDLNVWTESLRLKLFEAVTAKRVPLGQILISRGVLEAGKLTHLLDEYLSQLADGKSVVSPEAVANHVPSPQPVLFSEYSAMLNDNLKTDLSEMFGKLDRTQLPALYREIHVLHGAALLTDLRHTAALIATLEKAVIFAIKNPGCDLTSLKLHGAKAQHLIWALRGSVEETGSEKHYWDDTVLRTTHEEIMAALRQFPAAIFEQKEVA